jgi:hypothetical protein
MELIIRSNDEDSIAKIINLAEELHVDIETRGRVEGTAVDKDAFKRWLMNFKPSQESSRANASEWQTEARKDRDMPFRN